MLVKLATTLSCCEWLSLVRLTRAWRRKCSCHGKCANRRRDSTTKTTRHSYYYLWLSGLSFCCSGTSSLIIIFALFLTSFSLAPEACGFLRERTVGWGGVGGGTLHSAAYATETHDDRRLGACPVTIYRKSGARIVCVRWTGRATHDDRGYVLRKSKKKPIRVLRWGKVKIKRSREYNLTSKCRDSPTKRTEVPSQFPSLTLGAKNKPKNKPKKK